MAIFANGSIDNDITSAVIQEVGLMEAMNYMKVVGMARSAHEENESNRKIEIVSTSKDF